MISPIPLCQSQCQTPSPAVAKALRRSTAMSFQRKGSPAAQSPFFNPALADFSAIPQGSGWRVGPEHLPHASSALPASWIVGKTGRMQCPLIIRFSAVFAGLLSESVIRFFSHCTTMRSMYQSIRYREESVL